MKRAVLFLCLLAFCKLTPLAQPRVVPRDVPAAERAASDSLPEEAPAALKTIYSNLGKKGESYTPGGFLLAGPNSLEGAAIFTAMPFTPKSDAHVSQVQVAALYISGGNQINLSIYSDSGGVPGTLLAGPTTVTNLPTHGTCCTLDIAGFTPVAVIAGTQYWVVADTPLTGPGSDFEGEWGESTRPIFPSAFDRGTGWFSASVDLLPSGVVRGTIP
jgi:hypothetical protein